MCARAKQPKPKGPKWERREELSFWFSNDLYLAHRMLYLGKPNGSDDDDGTITAATAESIIKGLLALEAEDPTAPITIVMNSVGGSAYDAMAIYDMIRAVTCPVVVKAFGACMSAATIILQAANERVLAPNCIFMIHDGEDGYQGHPRDFERWAAVGKFMRFQMYALYASRSNKDVKFWEKKCDHDLILTATQAVELGLADRLLQLPQKGS